MSPTICRYTEFLTIHLRVSVNKHTLQGIFLQTVSQGRNRLREVLNKSQGSWSALKLSPSLPPSSYSLPTSILTLHPHTGRLAFSGKLQVGIQWDIMKMSCCQHPTFLLRPLTLVILVVGEEQSPGPLGALKSPPWTSPNCSVCSAWSQDLCTGCVLCLDALP